MDCVALSSTDYTALIAIRDASSPCPIWLWNAAGEHIDRTPLAATVLRSGNRLAFVIDFFSLRKKKSLSGKEALLSHKAQYQQMTLVKRHC